MRSIGAVRDSNVDVRKNVIRALGQIGDTRALPALTEAMKDADASVRRQAILAIAEISDGEDGHHGSAHPHPMPMPNPMPMPMPMPNPNPNPNPHPNPHNLRSWR